MSVRQKKGTTNVSAFRLNLYLFSFVFIESTSFRSLLNSGYMDDRKVLLTGATLIVVGVSCDFQVVVRCRPHETLLHMSQKFPII